MKRESLVLGISLLTCVFVLPTFGYGDVVFLEDFESGWGPWYSDNGVWEVGTPTAGPGGCHGGLQCAGTVLNGSFPAGTDSRLISPSITLPAVTGDEELQLRFWHWFSYHGGDYRRVQISYYDETAGWSGWENVSTSGDYDVSPVWSLKGVDISAYAGQRVRIAFFHVADGSTTRSGWYVDDIEIAKKTPSFTGDFESGWGDWYADDGVWEVGTPTVGPAECHGGLQCAGTVLDDDFPACTDSRLISPSITLPQVTGDEELQIRFWHWFSYHGGDYRYVQVSYYDETTGWSGWEDVSTSGDYDVSYVWSRKGVDITAYAGMKVRVAFYHIADCSTTRSGWYIDDIEVVKKVPGFTGDFEAGWGDWYADHGVWEVGTPSVGPAECHGGTQCAATVLDGNFPACTDSRLITPSIWLPEVTGGEELHLRFWHWFSYHGGDYRYIQISHYDAIDGWSGWENISTSGDYDVSNVWSLKDVDITSYAGMKVRVAFYHIADCSTTRSGWYIDDIDMPGMACLDDDGDGYGNPASPLCQYPEFDCNDDDPGVNPGVLEAPFGDPVCGDTLDNDCDGAIDSVDSGCCECIDDDSDGYGDPACENCTYPERDCDDENPDLNQDCGGGCLAGSALEIE